MSNTDYNTLEEGELDIIFLKDITIKKLKKKLKRNKWNIRLNKMCFGVNSITFVLSMVLGNPFLFVVSGGILYCNGNIIGNIKKDRKKLKQKLEELLNQSV